MSAFVVASNDPLEIDQAMILCGHWCPNNKINMAPLGIPRVEQVYRIEESRQRYILIIIAASSISCFVYLDEMME